MKKHTKSRFAILVFIFFMGIVGWYSFRKSPLAKIIGIEIFGDRALSNTMKEFRVKFIPKELIHYNPDPKDNISVSWAFRPEYAIATYPIPVVGDIDHDGKPEVFIGSHSRKVYALDGKTGNILWDWSLPFGVVGGRVLNLVDLNNDGKKELVFGSHTSLPIRVYALKTGKSDSNNRVAWKTNLSGDFFEGGISIVQQKGKKPLIVTITRDAPYSRGEYTVLKSDGSFLFKPISGVDDCISRPAVGVLPASKNITVIHGSHDYYKATFAHRIVARDLMSGKILWMSKKIGDTGFENHQIVDVDFDGKNEVLAIALDSTKKLRYFIINGLNGHVIKEVPWFVQGVITGKKQLLVCEGNKTKCLSKTGNVLYSIPKISFGLKEDSTHVCLFSINYIKDTLKINKYDADNGKLLQAYSCVVKLPVYKKVSDYGVIGPPANTSEFLTLADTDNDGNWDCLIQIKDFIVNVKLTEKVKAGTNPYCPIPFRNIDNGGVIY